MAYLEEYTREQFLKKAHEEALKEKPNLEWKPTKEWYVREES